MHVDQSFHIGPNSLVSKFASRVNGGKPCPQRESRSYS